MNFELGKVYSNPYARAFKPQQVVEADGDHEVKMAQGQLDYIIKAANELKGKLGNGEKNIPGWIQDHISKAHSYIHQSNSGYHEYGTDVNESQLEKNLINNISKTLKKRNPKIANKIIHDKVKGWIDSGKNLMIATNSSGTNYVKDVLIPIEKSLKDLKIDENINEGIIQDREKELKTLPKGAKVSGGGYGPFIKIGSDTFKNKNSGRLYHSSALASHIGTFKDFKIDENIKENIMKLAKLLNENTEPEIITQLRDVMKSGYKTLKDPKSGKKMKVDSYSASAIVKVYDAINQTNKDKFSKLGLLGMQNVAFKLMK